LKKSIVNISSGALGYILPMGMNLFFTPLIVKNLGSEAYGLQSLVNVIIGFLMVADMGLDIPVTKSVAELKAKNETIKLSEMLNSTLMIYLLIGLAGLIVLGLFSPILADHVFKVPLEYRERAVYVFYLAGIGFVGGLFSMWGKAVFDGFLRYDISNGINVISNLLSLIIGTILVVKGYGVVYYVMVRVIFTFLSGLAYLVIGKKLLKTFHISFKIKNTIWNMLKSQIGYGFLLRISGITVSRLDQVLIGIWIGVAAVGYYSIPLLIITSLTGLLNSMTHYLFPQMSELNGLGKQEELKNLFLKASRYIGILAFAIYTPFIILGPKFLNLWVGVQIEENASSVFILLIISAIISTIFAGLTNLYLVAIGKLDLFTKYILIRSASAGLIMFLLIRPLGLNGIGYAMIFAGILDAFFYIYVLINYIKLNTMSIFTNLYLRLTIIATMVGLFLKYTILDHIHNILMLVASGIVYLVISISLALLFKLFNRDEKELYLIMKRRFFKI
jgi:O-antigen/teichoic acid export membrane protein